MNEQQKPLLIGWAWANITPDQPIYLAGQLYGRVSQYVHDPVTATALVIRQADEQVVMVSADMVSVPLLVLEKYARACRIATVWMPPGSRSM